MQQFSERFSFLTNFKTILHVHTATGFYVENNTNYGKGYLICLDKIEDVLHSSAYYIS